MTTYDHYNTCSVCGMMLEHTAVAAKKYHFSESQCKAVCNSLSVDAIYQEPQHTIKSEQYTVHVHDCYQLTRSAVKAYCTVANSSDDGLPNSLCSAMISTTLFAAAGSDRASTQISATCSSTRHNVACLTKQSHCASWVVADLICSTSLEMTLISGPPKDDVTLCLTL